MKLKALIIASSLTLSINVYAEKLITPTLWAVAPDKFACNLTNVSDTTHTVRTTIISNGKVLLDGSKVELAPRQTADHFIEGFKDGAPIYCEFTVDGAKDQYRGTAKLFHAPNGSDFVAIPAQ